MSDVDLYHLEGIEKRMQALEKSRRWPQALVEIAKEFGSVIRNETPWVAAAVVAIVGFVAFNIRTCQVEESKMTGMKRTEALCANACGRLHTDYDDMKYDYEKHKTRCFCRPADGSVSKQIW